MIHRLDWSKMAQETDTATAYTEVCESIVLNDWYEGVVLGVGDRYALSRSGKRPDELKDRNRCITRYFFEHMEKLFDQTEQGGSALPLPMVEYLNTLLPVFAAIVTTECTVTDEQLRRVHESPVEVGGDHYLMGALALHILTGRLKKGDEIQGVLRCIPTGDDAAFWDSLTTTFAGIVDLKQRRLLCDDVYAPAFVNGLLDTFFFICDEHQAIYEAKLLNYKRAQA